MKLTKKNILKFINENRPNKEDSDEFLMKDIFVFGSEDDTKNFKLTSTGNVVLKQLLTHYTIKLNAKLSETTGEQVLVLSRYIRSPYHITRMNTLTVYEEDIASQLLLMDGDIETWIATKKYSF